MRLIVDSLDLEVFKGSEPPVRWFQNLEAERIAKNGVTVRFQTVGSNSTIRNRGCKRGSTVETIGSGSDEHVYSKP